MDHFPATARLSTAPTAGTTASRRPPREPAAGAWLALKSIALRHHTAMLIFWGTKHTTRKQGLVADFCPALPGGARLLRPGSASHLYSISFGQGELGSRSWFLTK